VQTTLLDAIIPIERRADVMRPTPVGGCPDLGDFVSLVD
jgi:hypothetical protein